MSQEPEALPRSLEEAIAFDSDGLVPAIARQHDSGEVLMMAWMSRESLAATLASGQVTYWSRSRKGLWRKGERSGQTQVLKRLLIDCDGDTLLLEVDQAGVACHTGRRSCFYRALDGAALVEVLPVTADPARLYGAGRPEGSES
ncbi:MAG: phosphoribosyl-AMP cyclohydrolase [Kiloniellales bacterium]|nr:phosphoribosyl-AMP cyclohydrolase [Kiloniellales bacterium]